MKKNVVCNNIGVCTRAKKVFTIDDEEQEMVCPECGGPLVEVKEPNPQPKDDEKTKKKKRIIAIIAAAIVVLAGVGFGIWKLASGGPQIDKIKLEPKSLTIIEGQKDVVKATVVDKDGKEIKDAKVTYKWTVDDATVASVTQDGAVTALTPGTTSVIVTIEGDDNHSANCQIVVNAKEPEVEPQTEQTEPQETQTEPKTGKTETPTPPVKKNPTYGTVDLGYGTYTGDLKNGKPNGHGTITYHRTHTITGSYVAERGDKYEGDFRDGRVSGGIGYWTHNGNVQTINP